MNADSSLDKRFEIYCRTCGHLSQQGSETIRGRISTIRKYLTDDELRNEDVFALADLFRERKGFKVVQSTKQVDRHAIRMWQRFMEYIAECPDEEPEKS